VVLPTFPPNIPVISQSVSVPDFIGQPSFAPAKDAEDLTPSLSPVVDASVAVNAAPAPAPIKKAEPEGRRALRA
jgi:hypothetical protein